MSRRIAPTDSLESLKREAKRWLKALRENVDGRARAARARRCPTPPTHRRCATSSTRSRASSDFPGWTALKEHFAGVRRRPAASPRSWSRGSSTTRVRTTTSAEGRTTCALAAHAMRLLARYPDIANASFYTRVVCGDLAEVCAILEERPELARTRDDPEPNRAGRRRRRAATS